MTPKIDEEFASLIPPLSPDEYSQLEKNLLADGCRDRLVVWGQILIDGHNRLRICTKHNIPYDVAAQNFADRAAAMKYIILNQFGRRNLSLGDRSILALKLEPLYKEQAKANQQQSPGRGKKGLQNSANLFPMDTRKSIAEIAGVSHDTIDKVRKIVEQGTPEQVKRVKAGGKGNSVSAVYNEIRKLEVPPPLPYASGSDNSRKSVSEAKNERLEGSVPDLNPAVIAEMFIAEYEAFTGQFLRGIEAFCREPYSEIYALLSNIQRENTRDLSDAMIHAIQNQIYCLDI
jgi:hypothetical protein